MSARVAIGLPAFERERYVGEALASLLAQTYTGLALAFVDDASTDGSFELAQQTAAGDSRVTFLRNERRAGMIENWRRAFHAARDAAGDCEYFAWASDHDVWLPRWLESLVAALDDHPNAVLAYPREERIDDAGVVIRGPQHDFSTVGVTDPRLRLARSLNGLRSGSTVYGLIRVQALEAAGVFPHVLHPDRALLLDLSLAGEFVQVPETLWRRRFRGAAMTRGRQRRMLFAAAPPASARLPSWLVHAGLLARRHGPAVGAVAAAIGPVHETRMRYRAVRRLIRIAKRRTRARLGRLRR